MAYVPNPADVTQPVETVLAQTAAAEFRALKQYIQNIVSGGGLGVATPGQVAMFPGDTPLPGWLEFDGALLTRTTYPALWAAAQALNAVVTEAVWSGGRYGNYSSGDLSTTFRLPDWRGVFPRGLNHGKVGAAFDSGRVTGQIQVASQIFDTGGAAGASTMPQTGSFILNGEDPQGPVVAYNITAGTSPGGGSQTFESVRPINIPTMFCVKT